MPKTGKAAPDVAGQPSFLKEPAWATKGSGAKLSIARFEALVPHIRRT